jgi:methyl-accepting chemotaxis protein
MNWMNKQTVSSRITIIMGAYLCVIVYLGYNTVTVVNKDINFASAELDGLTYQKPLESLLQSIAKHQELSLKRAIWKLPETGKEIEKAQASVEAAFEELQIAHGAVGANLGFSAPELAAAKLSQIDPQALRAEWVELKGSLKQLSAADLASKHGQLLKDIRSSIAYLSVTSNLVLDPDMDSYSVMDAMNYAIPELQIRLPEVLSFISVGLLEKPSLAYEDIEKLIQYSFAIQNMDLARIAGDTQAAIDSDEKYYGKSSTLAANLSPALAELKTNAGEFTTALDEFARNGAPKMSQEQFAELANKTLSQSFVFGNVATTELINLLNVRIAHYNHLKYSTLAATSVLFCLVTLFGYLMQRGITKPLKLVIDTLEKNSVQMISSVNELTSTSRSIAGGASEQASSLEEVAASIEEISGMSRHNADNAQQATVLSVQVREVSEQSVVTMVEMADAIGAIKKSADETAEIIKIIDDIAFQTNLLALNAAVEAARAGDAGKGFAVVADEVRNLAQRSATSAKETATKIKRSKELADKGVEVSSAVGTSLKQIKEKSLQAADIVREIAAAVKEQSSGISQVNDAVSRLDRVTQSNAAAAEEMAAASGSIQDQSSQLNESLDRLTGLVRKPGLSNKSEATETSNTKSKRAMAATAVQQHLSKVAAQQSVSPAATKIVSSQNSVPTRAKKTSEEIFPLDDNDFQGF